MIKVVFHEFCRAFLSASICNFKMILFNTFGSWENFGSKVLFFALFLKVGSSSTCAVIA